jgi:hypothetical protein
MHRNLSGVFCVCQQGAGRLKPVAPIGREAPLVDLPRSGAVDPPAATCTAAKVVQTASIITTIAAAVLRRAIDIPLFKLCLAAVCVAHLPAHGSGCATRKTTSILLVDAGCVACGRRVRGTAWNVGHGIGTAPFCTARQVPGSSLVNSHPRPTLTTVGLSSTAHCAVHRAGQLLGLCGAHWHSFDKHTYIHTPPLPAC